MAKGYEVHCRDVYDAWSFICGERYSGSCDWTTTDDVDDETLTELLLQCGNLIDTIF